MDDDPDVKAILKDILKWTKFQGMQKVKQVLENNLDNDAKKIIYELSDGRSSPVIAKIAKVSDHTVRDYWKLWAPIGIVEVHPNYKKRYCKVFSLKEVGILVPEFEVTAEETEEDTTGDE
jgi:hypothetical protein